MENLKYTVFDLFVYTLPGAFFLFCLRYVKGVDIIHPESNIDESFFNDDFGFFQISIYILCSYIAGFILTGLGNFILKGILFLFKRQKSNSKHSEINQSKEVKPSDGNQELPAISHISSISITKSEKYAVVREKAKENQKFIELWNALKNFCTSLAVVFILLAIVFYKRIEFFDWKYLCVGIIMAVLLFIKAKEYGRWAKIDLDNAYKNIGK